MPEDYIPPGTCVNNTCYVEAQDLEIRASWYNPELGGTNCMEPCNQLGDGSLVSEYYDKIIACPQDWYGRYLEIENVGIFQCRDSGGAIVPTCQPTFIPAHGTKFQCYIAIDFLTRGRPDFAYLLLDWNFVKKPKKTIYESVIRSWLTIYDNRNKVMMMHKPR